MTTRRNFFGRVAGALAAGAASASGASPRVPASAVAGYLDQARGYQCALLANANARIHSELAAAAMQGMNTLASQQLEQ
jgi:hypothetical protein